MSVCFFIGHHDAPPSLLPRLEEAVERHIAEYGVSGFVVGRRGNFDFLAAKAVQNAKKRHPKVTLTLLMAYESDRPGTLPGLYDAVLFPDEARFAPGRSAIVRANLYMVRHSDRLIAYDSGQGGNTGYIVKAAREREAAGLMRVENLAQP